MTKNRAYKSSVNVCLIKYLLNRLIAKCKAQVLNSLRQWVCSLLGVTKYFLERRRAKIWTLKFRLFYPPHPNSFLKSISGRAFESGLGSFIFSSFTTRDFAAFSVVFCVFFLSSIFSKRISAMYGSFHLSKYNFLIIFAQWQRI